MDGRSLGSNNNSWTELKPLNWTAGSRALDLTIDGDPTWMREWNNNKSEREAASGGEGGPAPFMADVEGARITALLKIETVRENEREGGRESTGHETRLWEEIKYTERREESLRSAHSEALQSV